VEPVETQRALLATEDIAGICVYPSPASTSTVISQTYDDRPYTKRLALVEAQLVPVFFELIVLERYFRDPRFECWFGDSNGNISIGDKAYLSDDTPERTKYRSSSVSATTPSGRVSSRFSSMSWRRFHPSISKHSVLMK